MTSFPFALVTHRTTLSGSLICDPTLCCLEVFLRVKNMEIAARDVGVTGLLVWFLSCPQFRHNCVDGINRGESNASAGC